MKSATLSLLRMFSLRTQLIATVLLASVLAGGVGSVTLMVLESRHVRTELTQELTTLAQLIGERSSAALVFMDSKTAAENLNALTNVDSIASACLLTERGELFAQYQKKNTRGWPCQPAQSFAQMASALADDTVHVQVPIMSGGELVGTVQINSTTSPLTTRYKEQMLAMATAGAGALVTTILLALLLQKVIARPIAAMRDVAHEVVGSKNFALRAPDLGQHELGEMASAFNAMLETIGTQNITLAERESYSKRLFYESPIAQLIADPDTMVYIDCNQAAARIHGHADRSTLIGTAIVDVVAPVQADGKPFERAILERRYAEAQDGSIQNYETRYVRRDGTLWDAYLSFSVFSRAGKQLIHVCQEDITYRKQVEENLKQLNDELEARVVSRTRDLANANLTLQQAHSELQRAQNELIQREKMASLGVLIAGVSHELNTPLGNGLTVASHMRDEVERFDADMATGKVSRSRVLDFTEQVHTGLDLLLRNLARAIEQVAHFKQVSVDQASDQRRQFDLKGIVTEIVSILQPQFKHTRHRINIEIPGGCLMDSYPGAIGQVVTNLVLNSLVHGFSEDINGIVSVSALQADADHVLLIVNDNGKGIPKKNLARVFDPFFTTRMGQGGSGLGLHIVYNIVTSNLGGNIQVSSEEGIRTTFTIYLPLVAPQQQV